MIRTAVNSVGVPIASSRLLFTLLTTLFYDVTGCVSTFRSFTSPFMLILAEAI